MVTFIINWLKISQSSSPVPLKWLSGIPRHVLNSVWWWKRMKLSIEFGSFLTTVEDEIHPADGVSFVPIRMTIPTHIFPWSTDPKLEGGVSKLWHTSVRFFRRRQMMCLINVELMNIKHYNYFISSSIQFTLCFKRINLKRFQFKEIYQLPITLVIICSMSSIKPWSSTRRMTSTMSPLRICSSQTWNNAMMFGVLLQWRDIIIINALI